MTLFELGVVRCSNTGRPRLLVQAIKVYNTCMKTAKRKRTGGRKATGKTPIIALRLSAETTARLDAWAAHKDYSRSEAMRAMIDSVLSKTPRASHLAANQLDRLADPTAHPDEQDRRKHRLLKGPGEFREFISQQRKKRRAKHTGL